VILLNHENESGLGAGYEGVGQFYDLFVDNSDIPFFLKFAKKMGSPILDLAAGTGRITLALAQEGYEVVAVESSPSMFAVAKQKILDNPELADRITLIQGSMTNFQLDKQFELIIIPNSFGHALNTEEQLSTLRCIHNHLSDTGVFILDLFPGAMQHEHAEFNDNPVLRPDGSTVERVGKIDSDYLRQIMKVSLRYIVRNSNHEIIEEVRVESAVSLLFNREVNLLLHLCNFEIENEFGDLEGTPYTPESGRRILILKKSKDE
jgi:SAM-dependent methyltransferase